MTRLAEMLSAPVAAYRTGRGVVSSEHDLSIGAPVGHALWPLCDVVLGIGTRLNQQMLWGADDALKIIHIDIDAGGTRPRPRARCCAPRRCARGRPAAGCGA